MENKMHPNDFQRIFYEKVEEIEKENIESFKDNHSRYEEDEHDKLKRHFSLLMSDDGYVYITWTDSSIPEHIRQQVDALPKQILK